MKQNFLSVIKIGFLLFFATFKLFAVREVVDNYEEYEINSRPFQNSRLYINLGKDSLMLSEKILRSRLIKMRSSDVRSLVRMRYLKDYYYNLTHIPAKILKTIYKVIGDDLRFYDDCLAGVYGDDIDPSSFGKNSYSNMKRKSLLKNIISKKILRIDDNVQRKVRKELFNYCNRYFRKDIHEFVIPWYKANYYRSISSKHLFDAINSMYPD